MTCQPHDWKSTGERRPHVNFVYKRSNLRHDLCYVDAAYVRCARCGQSGFRNAARPTSRVVYTWSKQSDREIE